jgi:anti-sigma regulatory factor (Ser/Thr protein kinase)
MTTAESVTETAASGHRALFYGSTEEYTSGIAAFLLEGLAAAEPALIAVPRPHLELIRDALGSRAAAVTFTDMAELGRNPFRIIPAVRQFTYAHPGRTRFAGEPIWAGRSAAEIREATWHEALINAAFAGVPTTILCPYDTSALDAAVLDDARKTHPCIHDQKGLRPSPAYDAPGLARAMAEERPAAAPADADELSFGGHDLARLRDLVGEHATRAGLGNDLARFFVFAVNEVATNTVVHAEAPGTLRIWHDQDALICEVFGPGRISDPLAGRHPPAPQADAGHGLWMVNQLCDLVELRTGAWGTAVRLHIQCPN